MTNFEAQPDESDFDFVPDNQVPGADSEQPYDRGWSESDIQTANEQGYYPQESDATDALTAEEPEDGYPDIDDDDIAAFLNEELDRAATSPPGPPSDLPPTSGGYEEPDDNEPSPELADRIFDMLASHPPTIVEQDQVRQQYGAIRWLGTDLVPSPIFRVFNAGSEDNVLGAVNNLAATRIVERHLDNFADYLQEIDAAARASQTVYEMSSEYAARGVVEEVAESPYAVQGEGLYLGQYLVRRMGETLSITRRALPPNSQYSDLLRHDHPNGEIHLVQRDSSVRYCITDTPDGTVVTEQTIHSLRPNDIAYLRDLSTQLTSHRDLLLEVAEAAGFSAETVVNPETNRIDTDFLYENVGSAIADVEFQLNLPVSLRQRLFTSVVSIWHSMQPSSLHNTLTNETEEQGLHAAAMRVRTFFDHLIRQRPQY